LAVTAETLLLKNHAVTRFFRAGTSARMKIWRKTPTFGTVMPRLKLLIFFRLLDSAGACEIRLDEDLSLSRSG
jgi:hypothetical protein